MAINPLFPFLAGALKARSDIKAINEDDIRRKRVK